MWQRWDAGPALSLFRCASTVFLGKTFWHLTLELTWPPVMQLLPFTITMGRWKIWPRLVLSSCTSAGEGVDDITTRSNAGDDYKQLMNRMSEPSSRSNWWAHRSFPSWPAFRINAKLVMKAIGTRYIVIWYMQSDDGTSFSVVPLHLKSERLRNLFTSFAPS